jgi:hypothetical protein
MDELRREMQRWGPAIMGRMPAVDFVQADLETRTLAPLLRDLRMALDDKTDEEKIWTAYVAVESELERVRAARKVQQ